VTTSGGFVSPPMFRSIPVRVEGPQWVIQCLAAGSREGPVIPAVRKYS
jgi:hypothetical protein